MITLDQIFRDLSYGELAQTAIGAFNPEEYESAPDPRHYAKLTSFVNQGLLALYKRFFLSSKEIYIQQYEQIATYVLDSKYAQSNVASAEPIKFIMDSVANPFQDDILKIEECYDEEGNKLFLNDVTEDLSIMTPNFKSIQIPYPNEFNTVAVQYRAAHPRIVYSTALDPTAEEIMLPLSLYEPLLNFVAYKVMMNTGVDGEAAAINYYQMFDQGCKLVEELGLEVQGEPGIWRFDDMGWV